jgi:small subunit ribosomal protein S18
MVAVTAVITFPSQISCSSAQIRIAIDYKNVELMTRFVNETGKIRPRRQTGTCAKHQREVAKAIKNARHIALIPFEGDIWYDQNA